MNENRGIKVKGIVLKRINYKEADRILTVYTDEFGKITALAKGVRKMTSKKRGHIEPMCYSSLYLIKIGEWYLITQSETINSFSNIKNSPAELKAGILILEALDKITETGDSNPILLELCVKTLKFIGQRDYLDITAAYLIKLLKLSGFYNLSQFKNFLISNSDGKPEEIYSYSNILEKFTFEKIVALIDNGNISHSYAREILPLLVLYFEMYADIKLKTLDISE